MSIITYPLNGISYDAKDAETYLSTRTSGVYSSDDHFGVQVSGARQITISPGLAWINNAGFCGKSIAVTEAVTLDVPVADGALARKDLVVLRYDASANASFFAIVSGTASSAPVAPSPTRTEAIYELGLYVIDVPAGSLEVVRSNIESKILDEEFCGVMRDGVTGIPTSEIETQARELIADLKEKIGEIVSVEVSVDDSVGTPSASGSIETDESGNKTFVFEFSNLKAKTPERGVDYWTTDDIASMEEYIDTAVEEASLKTCAVTYTTSASISIDAVYASTVVNNVVLTAELKYGAATDCLVGSFVVMHVNEDYRFVESGSTIVGATLLYNSGNILVFCITATPGEEVTLTIHGLAA